MPERIIKLDRYEIGAGSLDEDSPPVVVGLRIALEGETLVLEMTPERALCLAKDLLDTSQECVKGDDD